MNIVIVVVLTLVLVGCAGTGFGKRLAGKANQCGPECQQFLRGK